MSKRRRPLTARSRPPLGSDGDAASQDAASFWVVRNSWQGPLQDLVRIARTLEDWVDGVVVIVRGRVGQQRFDSVDHFAEGVTTRLVARATSIEMSGQTESLRMQVQFLSRSEPLDGDSRVSGVAARVWVTDPSAQDAGAEARDVFALELDLGEDPFRSKTLMGGAQDSYAAAWRRTSASRTSWILTMAVVTVAAPLALATALHNRLEPGKSTLTDVLIWCACNPYVVYATPVLFFAAYVFLFHALPAVDIDERPALRRLVAPVGKVTGTSYVIAALGKLLAG